ncbi:MAG: serine/threonine-protein kinase [Gemmatimonadaceae bacterium]
MPERFLGRTLGRFRVDAIIGAGGFAWVYKAYDPELDIPVALKILKPQYAGDEKFEQRFRREASTAAKLRHPNIIKIYAVGREEDAVYFAMDYLPQGLADRLNVMTQLPEQMLIRMAIDVASALGFAHREGVIHRDIKTDNILFDEHGNAVVADFGIARAVATHTDSTGTNMVVGTPQYFSPEQARGLQLDGRADIYSLGVTLFKSATGQLPFQGTDWYEIARQHVEDKPPKPRSINPALSREMEDVILQCLEKDPNDRFATGEALCEELIHILQERGETAAVRSSGIVSTDTLSGSVTNSRIRRRVRRHRGWWLAGGGAAALLLAIGGFAAARAKSNSDRARRVAATTHVPATTSTPVRVAPPRPGATKPRLIINVPKEAAVTINGVNIGSGPFTLDTLGSGTYQVAATVAGARGCSSLRDEATAMLVGTAVDTVTLNPRNCGTLELNITPDGASYTLQPLGNERARTGTLPLKEPLLLPAGAYRITVEHKFCAQYTNQRLRITAGRVTSERARLICDRG